MKNNLTSKSLPYPLYKVEIIIIIIIFKASQQWVSIRSRKASVLFVTFLLAFRILGFPQNTLVHTPDQSQTTIYSFEKIITEKQVKSRIWISLPYYNFNITEWRRYSLLKSHRNQFRRQTIFESCHVKRGGGGQPTP